MCCDCSGRGLGSQGGGGLGSPLLSSPSQEESSGFHGQGGAGVVHSALRELGGFTGQPVKEASRSSLGKLGLVVGKSGLRV